jgi:hypothetical protein
MIRNLNRHDLLLVFFYLLAHGGLLLVSNSIYWDDWLLYRTEPSVILDTFKQTGSMFNVAAYMHIGLIKIGPWIYRILTLILMFTAGLFLNSVLKRYKNINESTRFFIVLMFLILPFNIGRVALIDFGYSLCYFLFFLAWMLMDRFRFLSLILFFISFNTNSLLVFFAVPFFDMLYRKGCLTSWKNTLRCFPKHIDYVLLPFIYFYIKTQHFKPSGLYENYNETYDIQNLITSPLSQLVDLFRLHISIGLAGVFFIISFYVLKKFFISAEKKQCNLIDLFFIGVLIFILGAFPYWILGHVPTFSEWTSRHQLLLPLGSSLILVATWLYLKESLVFFSAIIGLSLAFNVAAYKDLFFDWQKQKQLIELFSLNSEIENARLIVIDDQTTGMNALARGYRFYEWNAIFYQAFGDQKRFGISQAKLPEYLAGQPYDDHFFWLYKAKSFKENSQLKFLRVRIDLVVPNEFKERLVNKMFPQFSITTVQANLGDIVSQ